MAAWGDVGECEVGSAESSVAGAAYSEVAVAMSADESSVAGSMCECVSGDSVGAGV